MSDRPVMDAEIDRLALELLGLSVDERAELRQRLGMAGLVLAVGRSPNCIAERDAALAEVARLREALERISAILPCGEPCKPRVMCGTCHRGDDTDGEIDCTGCIARAALGRTQ